MKTPGFDRDGRSVEEWVSVETEVWEPDADRPGYLRKVRTKTVREVYDELRAALFRNVEYTPGCGGFYVNDDCDEYFNLVGWADDERVWPEGRIVVFPVTGGSEGHYIHVEVLTDTGGRELILLGKTFAGWDAAWRFAKALGEVLGV